MNRFRWSQSTLIVAAASLLAAAPALLGVARAWAIGRTNKRPAAESKKTDPVTRGQALFLGGAPLTARIREHDTPLPAAVVVCANCHGAQSQPTSVKRAAPLLDGPFLMEERSRRGAPPSAYDLPSFCRMLRTGIDPVSVLVAREMPTYELDDARCADLWRYLTQPKPGQGTAAVVPAQPEPPPKQPSKQPSTTVDPIEGSR